MYRISTDGITRARLRILDILWYYWTGKDLFGFRSANKRRRKILRMHSDMAVLRDSVSQHRLAARRAYPIEFQALASPYARRFPPENARLNAE